MEISVFSILDAYEEHGAGGRDRYVEFLDLARATDAAGFSRVWVAEHHFQASGVCPSPPVLLAATGSVARRCRVGAMVSVLPFHAAIDLAEEYALLDRLLGGRLDLGLGSGYIPSEFEGFGLDPKDKRELFEARLERMLAAWRGEKIVGVPDRSTPVSLNVRPVQKPHPPLWVAAQRREAVPFIARAGRNLALVPYATLGKPEELVDIVRDYRSALPPGVKGTVSVALHLYEGPRVNEARSALQRYLDTRRSGQSVHFLEKVAQDPRHSDAHHLEADGFAALGSSEHVDRLLERYRSFGVDEVLGIVDFGALPPEGVEASVRAIGRRWGRRRS